MTYFAFLALFLGIPMLLLSAITLYDYRRGRWMPSAFRTWTPWKVILGLCVVAFIYTTPWDNYLVATGVWFYDPELVTGMVIGWVPIEEYTFFILLPIFTSLWTLLLMRYMPVNPQRADWSTSHRARCGWTLAFFVLWVASVVVLVLTFVDPAWKPFTYMSLILVWALIPIMIQTFFGADILLRHWRIVTLSIVTSTLYLSATDAVAITAGTWTIEPSQSLPILLGGVLPIEEFTFFLIVNVLVVLGLTLVLSEGSYQRLHDLESSRVFALAARGLKALVPPPSSHTRGVLKP